MGTLACAPCCEDPLDEGAHDMNRANRVKLHPTHPIVNTDEQTSTRELPACYKRKNCSLMDQITKVEDIDPDAKICEEELRDEKLII